MSDGRKRFAKHVGLQIRVTQLLDNIIRQLTYFIFTFVLFLCTVTYEDNKMKQYLKCLHLFEMLIHSYYIGFWNFLKSIYKDSLYII